MKFKRAVEDTPSTQNAFCTGLQALRAGDRPRISPDNPQGLAGSLNLDEALRSSQPNNPRWDYGVAYQRAQNRPDHIFWIEVHPARTVSHRDEVEEKLDWLRSWLVNEGWRLGKLERYYIWISTGKSVFTMTSPQMKALAQKGLIFAGRHYKIR